MRFQVPQFIEVEDKVFGPLTVRQFIYLAGGGGLAYLIYAFLPFILAILLIPPVVILSLMLAFYKINDRPFIYTLESAVKFYIGGKLYIWKKAPVTPTTTRTQNTPQMKDSVTLSAPVLSESKLKDLAWSLDIKRGNGR